MRVRISRRGAVMVLGGGALGIWAILKSGEGLLGLWESVTAAGAAVLAAVLHELGHLLAARCCGVTVRGLRLDLFGARMELAGVLSYRREAFVAAGGPLFNLLCAAFLLPHGGGMADGDFWGVFTAASVGLCALNLLPVRGLDGGRMLVCGVSALWGPAAGDTVLRLTTALCLGVLWLLSVYALLRVGQMLSCFAFALCLLLRLLDPETGQNG